MFIFIFLLTLIISNIAEAAPPTPLAYQSAPGVFTTVSTTTPLPITIQGGVSANVNIGTSLSAANPQVSGDATTGFYTPAAGQVAVDISGAQIVRWSSTGENITGSLGVSGVLTVPQVSVSGNVDTNAWLTNGVGFQTLASTYTDTSSSGTVALQAVHNIAQPTVAASQATTYTESATLRIASHPSSGTNVTQSRFYALMVQGSGGAKIEGALKLYPASDTTSANGRFSVGGATSAANWTTTSPLFAITSGTQTDTSGSGTVAVRAVSMSVAGNATSDSLGAITLTDAVTAYFGIPTAGTNVTITNPWSIYTTGGIKVAGSSTVSSLDLGSTTTALILPVGTTGQRPTAASGMLRYNSTTNAAEAYVNGAWVSLSPSDLGTSVSAASPSIAADRTTGLYTPGAAQVGVTISGTNRAVFTAGGLVIGSTAQTTGTSLDLGTNTDSLLVPVGTTGQRPTAANGMIRYNSTTPGFELYNNSAGWITFGIPSGDNTTTGASLAIGINALANQTAAGSGNYRNTAIGYSAMGTGTQTTAAVANTAVGFQAFNAVTSANSVTAVGSTACTAVSSGSNNSCFGTAAGAGISTGTGNTALGNNAIQSANPSTATAVGVAALQNLSGSQSVAVGSNAGQFVSTGTNETAVGYLAMTGITGTRLTGAGNTAIGASSGNVLQGAAANNTLVGLNSGVAITTGSSNTAVGSGACATNATTGSACNALGLNALTSTTGAHNTGLGGSAGQFISSGTENTAVGYQALLGITGTKTTGNQNTGVGSNAGLAVQGAAADNTMVGYNSGATVTTGTNNTIIGSGVGSTTLTTGTNNILIGVSSAVTTAASSTSNTIQLGGTGASGGAGSFTITGTNTLSTEAATLRGTLALTDIGSDATHTDSTVCQDTTTHILFSGSGAAGICLGTSSIRFKKDVKPLISGLEQITAMKPVTFYYKKGFGDNGARHQYGFIAEEMYKVNSELTAPDKDGKPQSVDYMAIMPVLVKAVQELKEIGRAHV